MTTTYELDICIWCNRAIIPEYEEEVYTPDGDYMHEDCYNMYREEEELT